MDINLDKYAEECFNVSREEMEEIKKINSSNVWSTDIEIRALHKSREWEKQHGKHSLRTQPLAHIMSLIVKPNQEDDKQLALHGTIYARFFDKYQRPVAHQIYRRASDFPEILGIDDNRSLTLNGPEFMFHPDQAYLPLFQTRVDVNLFDGNSIFAKTSFFLDDDIDDNYERVKSKVVHCQQGSLTLQYIAIPFGVHCRLQVTIPRKECVEKDEILNVNGTIVARYAETYGDSSQDCVLFKKQDTEFEQVEFGGDVKLFRCWVSLPAYSSLIVKVDLSEFGSGRKIAYSTTSLLPQEGLMSQGGSLFDDSDVLVGASWFSPEPCYKCLPQIPTMDIEGENLEQEIAEIDIDGEDEASDDDGAVDDDTVGDDESSSFADDGESLVDDESGDVLSSSLKRRSWVLYPHKNKLRPSTAVEIFSVFIGQEKSKAVQIYGSFEVFRHYDKLCCIFRRDEKEALMLSENLKFIPIQDGSRVFASSSALKMEFDIKDIDGCLAIKGYMDWPASSLDKYLWHEKQLCSLIQGQQGGFAAIHYSIFDEAVCVTIKVLLKLKKTNVNPKVWGSFVTQYSRYDYSSRYNKDHYRSVLFKRTRENPVQISTESTIPLSRSTIVVPSYSSLIVNVDLSFDVSDQKLSCAKKIKIGEDWTTIDTNDHHLVIKLDWCDVN